MILAALVAGSPTKTAVDLPTRDQARRLVSEAERRAPVVFAAPELSAWPDDLPDALDAGPGTGVVVASTIEVTGVTIDLGVGTWLDAPLADAVWERLMEVDTYPGRCQARLDALADEIVASAIDVTADLAMTEAELRQAEDAASRYSLGDVIGWAAVGVVVGVVVAGGIVIGVSL